MVSLEKNFKLQIEHMQININRDSDRHFVRNKEVHILYITTQGKYQGRYWLISARSLLP